jgi:polar amino acid transport system permease protein
MIQKLIDLMPGLGTTLLLTGTVLLVGVPLGLLAGWAMTSRHRPIRVGVNVMTEVGRGFPALVVLYLVYFGLPNLSLTLPAFTAVVTGFSFTTASYVADTFRSAIEGVPMGQREAADSLALSQWKAFRLIILPQALRACFPVLVGFAVIVFQGTALAFGIGMRELMGTAYGLGTVQFDVMGYLVIAGALYLVVALVLTAIAAKLVHRNSRALPS